MLIHCEWYNLMKSSEEKGKKGGGDYNEVSYQAVHGFIDSLAERSWNLMHWDL